MVKLLGFGSTLRRGLLIVTGALRPMIDVSADDEFEADRGELGVLTARFTRS